MNDGSLVIRLFRAFVFLALLVSVIVSGLAFLIGFGNGNFLSIGLQTQVFLAIPFLSVAVWALAYSLKIKSPWPESLALASPLYQLICIVVVQNPSWTF